ncbi:Dipeptide transport system permease protein DppB [Serinicoccus hydrothermalis]|uniref:Dipeptide transport system permease protein DppB n=1 Tax=Serinicoccus hydrothermalis TaxID=1758689 RepID=A0A1B1NG41_9MICO|nr:ABC transporter permease [Serinicoccus hydrothermalis]ANS80382.1 Dipeptide transport system permease protein DppB [Serinicoccus hydrothermalis]
MLRFIVRRMLQAVLALFVLSVLLFAWLRSLPGGVVSALLGERGTPESQAALRAALGLDQPLPVQYWRFLQRAVQGDFGISNGVYRGQPALDVFTERFPATVELAIFAMVLALVFALPLGYLAARRRGGAFDTGSIVFSLVGVAVPVFFLAYVLKYIFAVQLGWLPPSGRQDVTINATHITNFYVLDGLLTREWDAAWDAFKHLILPAIALSSIPFAIIFRITRAAVIDVMDEDYVRTARAKGLRRQTIRLRHVMRNALIPVVTIIGLQIGALLAGAVLTEKVFAFTGIGQALALGFELRDYPVLQVLIMMAALIYIVVNLIVDVTYAIIDPRVRT